MVFDDWSDSARVIAVGTLAYAALVACVSQNFRQANPHQAVFDLVITVALGSTLSAVLINKSLSLAEGVTAFALLISLQFCIIWLSVPAPSSISSSPNLRAVSPRRIPRSGAAQTAGNS